MCNEKDYRRFNCDSYVDELIEFKENMIMCLCPKCRSMFFSTPGVVIKRVDKAQNAKDTYSYCNKRSGFDYYVCEKPDTSNRSDSNLSKVRN